MTTVIGVLALQGDYEAHRSVLNGLPEVTTTLVRDETDLELADGLVMPGGESTTIGKLMVRMGLMEPLTARARSGMPVYGTCAGMILMAGRIEGSDQPRLGLMDITVARNAFGRQIDSFEADIEIPALCETHVRGVFIRAPYVTETGEGVEVLARYGSKIVAVRQASLLATAFHPELARDARIHSAFADVCRQYHRTRLAGQTVSGHGGA